MAHTLRVHLFRKLSFQNFLYSDHNTKEKISNRVEQILSPIFQTKGYAQFDMSFTLTTNHILLEG